MPAGHDDHAGGRDAGASPAREMLPRWRVKMYGHQPVVVQALDANLALEAAAHAVGLLFAPDNAYVLRLKDDAE